MTALTPSVLQSAAELFDNIKIMGSESKPVQTVCITSAGTGEGKTFAVHALGAAIAAQGNSVLLVDANLRHPTLAQEIGVIKPAQSISAVNYSQAVLKTKTDGLSVLPLSGLEQSHSPLLLAGSEKFAAEMKGLAAQYDYIVFDTPAVKEYEEAVVLAAKADVTLIVVEQKKTRREDLGDALQALQDGGAHLGGFIMNARPARFARKGK